MSRWKTGLVFTFLLILLICVLLAVLTVKMAKERYNADQVIFSMADPVGDDYGPGTYKYPISSIFDPKSGHFDLQRFSLFTRRGNYYFDLSFPIITNPWGAAEGFSQTMIQIYIATDPDKGRIEPFKEGANIVFDPQYPWSYLLKVVSFNKTAVYWATDYADADGRSEGVQARLQADQETIRVTAPKSFLPGDPYQWRFYVLVGAQDGLGPDNFRVVNAQIGQWTFGGGSDTEYNPNVIDLLAPAGSQEKMLGAYDPAQRVQAIIQPVGPSQAAPGWRERILDGAIVVLQKMKLKL